VSRYEWEKGSVLIPSTEWAAFRHHIVEAYNDYQERKYKAAVRLWEKIRQRHYKAKDADFGPVRDLWTNLPTPKGMNYWEATRAIFREDHGRPLKPRKKDFPTLPKTTTTKVPVGCEASIRFDVDNRKVYWNVPENNHAREHAWRHPVAQAFSRALNSVRWTRKSGGYFVGNDEYNEDSSSIGGSGNYVTMTFGPSGEKARQPVTHYW